jgi:lipid-binding SYLF domain-containing protein
MFQALRRIASKFFSAVETEATVIETLHKDVQATLKRLQAEDAGLKQLLDRAHAYAVFPSVGKATAVIGGAFGKGEVFEKGDLVGYAAIIQLTLGVQLGGQTFAEVIAFENEQALDRFKAGKWAWAANASAVLVKAGAAASANYESGAAVFVYADGGMMLEAAVGGQKFIFRPAVLGRTQESGRNRQPATKTKSTKKSAKTARRTPAKRTPARRKTKSRGPSPRTSGRSSGKRAQSSGRARSGSRSRSRA